MSSDKTYLSIEFYNSPDKKENVYPEHSVFTPESLKESILIDISKIQCIQYYKNKHLNIFLENMEIKQFKYQKSESDFDYIYAIRSEIMEHLKSMGSTEEKCKEIKINCYTF